MTTTTGTAPPPTRPGLGAAVSSLRGNRRFQLLWTSNLLFFGAGWTQTIVLGWMAYTMTHSEFLVGVFTAARLGPMLLGPLSGALADRYSKVKLLIAASLWATVGLSVVALLAGLDRLPFWGLVLGGLIIGLAQSPSQPARAALAVELVGRGNVSNANALNALAINSMQVIGPAVGGSLIALIGAPLTLWLSVLWYAAALLLILPLRKHRSATPRRREPVLAMTLSGFRVLGTNRLAAAVLAVTLAANCTLWPVYQSFMPVFAERVLLLDAAGLGVLMTCAGAGGLLGSLAIAALGDFRRKGALFVLGTCAWAALWVLFSLSSLPWLSFLLMAAIGVLGSCFVVLQSTLLLLATDPLVHGRMLGLQELAIGIMPVSTLGLGALAQVIGLPGTTRIAGGLVILLLSLLMWRVPGILKFSGRTPT